MAGYDGWADKPPQKPSCWREQHEAKAREADGLRAVLRELVAQIDEEIEPRCCEKPFNDALNSARAALGEKQ